MSAGVTARVVGTCSSAVTPPPSDDLQGTHPEQREWITGRDGANVMSLVITAVMCVVDLATNRSVVNVERWSRRTLRSVIDWSDKSGSASFRPGIGRSGGATRCEPEGSGCD
ncbi:hypothetical protein Q0Z83_078540 [Actinoplanes sichuanensis]|nr:hypothetical protein Q0Z83_078540 [Actinoplanes sichuanensis]